MARCWSWEHTSSSDTIRYGTAQAHAWHRCHPRLEHRGPWREHPGPLPIIEGTLIRLQVGRRLRAKIPVPAGAPKPSRPGPGRPPGIPNQHRAPRHDVGKISTRAQIKTVEQPIKG
jgi:hypothetical protein